LILHDTYAPLLEAQQLDLLHTGLDIEVSSDSRAAESADICLFAAGSPRNPSIKTRADLLSANLPVADTAVQTLGRFDGILITVTNPMDANNYYLCKKSGIDRHRCIGFGGQLDSARFNLALAERCIPGDGWVLGEHGEHQVPVFGTINGGVQPDMREEILTELRGSSMEVINGKGGTVFGPAYHRVRTRSLLAGGAGSDRKGGHPDDRGVATGWLGTAEVRSGRCICPGAL